MKSRFKRWEKTGERGKVRYIALWIMYFLFLGLIFSPVFQYLLSRDLKYDVLEVIFRVIIFGAGGILFSFSSWRNNENNYKKSVK